MTEQITMSDAESASSMPPLAEGWSRLALFAGLGLLAVGHLLGVPAVVWGSVAVLVVAFGLNTAAKLLHYRGLAVPRRDRLALATSWVLLAVTVLGVIVNYAYTRYGPGDGSFFWALGVAGFGFGLLHMAAQSTYLPDEDQ